MDAERSGFLPADMKKNEIVLVVAALAASALLVTSGLPFWIGLGAAVVFFSAIWLLSLPLGNASIVDFFWGPGFVLIGWLYLLSVPDQPTLRGLLACVLVSVWGLRLAAHIGIRNAGHGEDFRYRSWREQAGPSFWWISFFKVFLLQAVILWIVSSPLLLAQIGTGARRLTALDIAGLLLWIVGFGFEAVADWQLLRFKREPANRGRVLDTGLWSLSRHPNYFGETVLWWGIGLIALAGGGWLALVGPALLTFLLLKISGVAMLDAALVERKPKYAEYIRSTPAFIPRWPKHRDGDRATPAEG
jgi:steroid 5-alpha reductase family enzyme